MNIKCAIKKKGGYRSRWLFFVLLCGSIIILIKAKYYEDQVIRLRASLEKMSGYNNVFDKWLRMRETGKSLLTFFSENGYQRIAIYGMGDVGHLLFRELETSKIKIKYGIDKNPIGRGFNLPIITPSNDMEKVDAIIVTAVFIFDDIRDMLESMVNYPVVALDDLIYELC